VICCEERDITRYQKKHRLSHFNNTLRASDFSQILFGH